MLFGKRKDPELIVLNFMGQLQCSIGGKRQGPIEVYPKFWNLNLLEKQAGEILNKPDLMQAFNSIRKELQVIFQRDMLPVTLSEHPTMRWLTLGMSSSMLVPSMQARNIMERQQRVFMHAWIPCSLGTPQLCEIKIPSWTNTARKMRISMPPKCDVRDVKSVLEKAGFERRTQYRTMAEK